MLFDPCLFTVLDNEEIEPTRKISPAMQQVNQKLRRIATMDMPILIESEFGNNTELIAKSIHENSTRHNKPFYSLNCLGLTDILLETELFGHTKNTFIDSKVDRKGLFQLADKGTLFLNEIENISLNMQAKLIRTLQNGLIYPIGGISAVSVDVRVITGTNRVLAKMIKEKDFRQDFYFCINGFSITLPPLRERSQDIPQLFGHFLKEVCDEANSDIHMITEPAMQALMNYTWPGNIQQLRNVVQAMVVNCKGETLDLRDLPLEISPIHKLHSIEVTNTQLTSVPDMLGKKLEEVEKEHLRQTLELTGNNRAEAAKILHIGERTLYRKIKEYNL